jgi:hypothetical protein
MFRHDYFIIRHIKIYKIKVPFIFCDPNDEMVGSKHVAFFKKIILYF